MSETIGGSRIAVVGTGAVGGYFGGLFARAGASVVLIGRKPFVDAVSSAGLFLDTLQFQATVPVQASMEMSAVRDAGLVLFCVKTTDNGTAAREMAQYLAPGAIVVSMQNGVDNVEQIRAATGIDAVPAAVYVAVSVTAPGQVKHVGRGDLVIGPESDRSRRIANVFEAAGIPCRISCNIEGELWAKFVSNCALNAISALGQARYGLIADCADARALMEGVVNEVLAVACKARIVLPGIESSGDVMAGVMKVAGAMRGASSSTAQDLKRVKATEIDSLNGYIVRRGAELGVPTPLNHALYTLVKLVEHQHKTAA
jgi:2-dehydropantoate 2-reductase